MNIKLHDDLIYWEKKSLKQLIGLICVSDIEPRPGETISFRFLNTFGRSWMHWEHSREAWIPLNRKSWRDEQSEDVDQRGFPHIGIPSCRIQILAHSFPPHFNIQSKCYKVSSWSIQPYNLPLMHAKSWEVTVIRKPSIVLHRGKPADALQCV